MCVCVCGSASVCVWCVRLHTYAIVHVTSTSLQNQQLSAVTFQINRDLLTFKDDCLETGWEFFEPAGWVGGAGPNLRLSLRVFISTGNGFAAEDFMKLRVH